MKNKADRKYRLPRFLACFTSDFLAVLLAWFLSYYLRFFVLPGARHNSWEIFAPLSIVALLVSFFFLNLNHLYELNVSKTWQKVLGDVGKTSFEVFVTMTVIYYFCYPNRLSRLSLLLFWAFLFIFLLIGRSIVIASFTHAYANGKYVRNVLFVGYGEKLAEFKKISQQEDQGLSPCGQYHGEKGPFACPQIEAETLEEAIEKTGADLIVISFPLEDSALENEMVAEGSDLLEQRLILLPHFPKSYAGTTIEDFHSIPVIHLNAAEMDMLQRIEKRTFDIVACTIAVALLSPLYLLLAILVKCSSKGPVFFKQARVTRDGKVFTMYKFRSMRTDMPEGKAHWTEENDPRVTKIGRILRKTSLDEIPQFFNVLGGSMSLIGPRPERPELEEGFKKTIPGYNMRHRMKAGISGWAQVNGLRGNTSLSKRIDYDLYYVRNWSIWFDFKIVFMTFFKGFVNKNAY